MQKSNLIRLIIGLSLLANLVPYSDATVASCITGSSAASLSLGCTAGVDDGYCMLLGTTSAGSTTYAASCSLTCTAGTTTLGTSTIVTTCCTTADCNTIPTASTTGTVSSCWTGGSVAGFSSAVVKAACTAPNNVYCMKTTSSTLGSSQSCSSTCVAGTALGVTTTCCQTDNCNSSSRVGSNKLFALLFILSSIGIKYIF